MQNLTRRGLTYFARFHIPRERQRDVGRAYGVPSGIVRDRTRTLQTRDRAEAQRRLGAALEAIRAEVDAKLSAARMKPLGGDWTADWVLRALSLRGTLRSASSLPVDAFDDEAPTPRDLTMDDIREATTAVAEVRGLAEGNAFWSAATATGLSIEDAAQRWLAVEGASKRASTMTMHRATLALLTAYMRDHHGIPSLDVAEFAQVTRRVAAGFMEWRAKTPTTKTGRSPARATIQRELSTLMGLWRWGVRNGHAEANPWTDQIANVPETSKDRTNGDEDNDPTKRPYDPAEQVALLRAGVVELAPNGGGYGPALWDAIRLGLLTGLRANELASLRCGDVTDNGRAVVVRRGKTRNAVREVPLSATAARVIAARLATLPDTSSAAPLWPEIPPSGADERRGKLLSSRFARARFRVLPTSEGVDFHSLRRSFAAAVRDVLHRRPQLGSPELLSVLMGHREGTLALRLYAPGALDRTKRRIINAMEAEGLHSDVRRALMETAGGRPPVVRTAPGRRTKGAGVAPVEAARLPAPSAKRRQPRRATAKFTA